MLSQSISRFSEYEYMNIAQILFIQESELMWTQKKGESFNAVRTAYFIIGLYPFHPLFEY